MGMAAIVAGLFLAMLAVRLCGPRKLRRARAEKAAADGEARRDAPFPGFRNRARTADEVVSHLEHRIDADQREVADLMRRNAAAVPRLERAPRGTRA
jgi:hypothetical protein